MSAQINRQVYLLVNQGYSLRDALEIATGTTGASRLPRRRNGKYFSAKPSPGDDKIYGKPYSRGVLRREMEIHPTMRSRMIGLIRWAGQKHGVSLREATIKKMLGKAARDLPTRLREIKRLADKAFYAGMRKMHALPDTEIVEPVPAKKTRKTARAKARAKKRRTA